MEVEFKEDYICIESGKVVFEKGKRYPVTEYNPNQDWVICMYGEPDVPTLGHCRKLKQSTEGLVVYGKGVKRIG